MWLLQLVRSGDKQRCAKLHALATGEQWLYSLGAETKHVAATCLRIKQRLAERLEECGWKEQIRKMAAGQCKLRSLAAAEPPAGA